MKVITCPSGLSLEIRGLKGKELKLLQDKAAKKTGRTYDNILTACTVSVITRGPAYTFEGDGAPEWDKILVGDKFYALLAIRAETFGEDYDFKFQCNACEERVPWYVKLPDGLGVKKLAPEDAKAFAAGEPLETVLPGDLKVAKYRLAVGADERASALNRQEDAVLTMLARRIVSIDGVPDPKSYLEEASLNDTKQIVKAFEAHDCGVETDIEVQCPKCSAIQEVRLPLERNFWMPVK
jgi:hypothetical protein